MPSLKERVLDILNTNTKEDAISALRNEPDLRDYLMKIGIDKIEATVRRNARREIKFILAPEYTSERRAVRFTMDTIKRVHNHSVKFIKDWYIGGVTLGDLTKEELLIEAEKEKKSGTGHLVNARIYEILAEPLQPGQRMREYWNEQSAKSAASRARDESHPPNGV